MPRLLAYPVLAAAVTAFQRDRIKHDRDSLLDALVVTVAAAQIGWLVLIDPLVTSASAMTTLTTGAYLAGHLLVLAVAARLGFAVVGSNDGVGPPAARGPRDRPGGGHRGRGGRPAGAGRRLVRRPWPCSSWPSSTPRWHTRRR